MNGGWVFLIILILLGLIGGGGYFAYRKYYLKRGDSTFAYPSPAPSGIADKLKNVWDRLRNPKTQTGAGYEATGSAGNGGAYGGRRGHALDPDEAWDTRVGNEADVYAPGGSGYYEEQELGMHQPTEYRGAGGGFRQTETLGAPTGGDRPRSKSPAKSNPFGDDNAASMRSVSPRPHVDTNAANASHGGKGSAESSPTFERRSIFREEV